jgi:hypothetical protein
MPILTALQIMMPLSGSGSRNSATRHPSSLADPGVVSSRALLALPGHERPHAAIYQISGERTLTRFLEDARNGVKSGSPLSPSKLQLSLD